MTKVIAVDLGGTNLRVSLVQNNKIIKYMKDKTPKTQKELENLLFKNIEHLMEKDVKGIGIASAGPLEKGIIKNPPNLPLRNYNIKAALEKRFKKKVEVCNDAHSVAFAELKLGVKKKNFIVLTIGTGVGGGIIIDGKLYEGQGYGGEMGHIILHDGKSFEKLVGWKYTKELVVGDLLTVRPGERVPVDGVIVRGKTEIDQSALTGESWPVSRQEGEQVHAGTLNQLGGIVIQAEKIGGETTFGQIVQLVGEAIQKKSSIERQADRLARLFLPVVLGIAAATLIVWRMRMGYWSAGWMPALSVLVVACPCPLILATPSAVLADSHKASPTSRYSGYYYV